jgi:hypothetical protein
MGRQNHAKFSLFDFMRLGIWPGRCFKKNAAAQWFEKPLLQIE